MPGSFAMTMINLNLHLQDHASLRIPPPIFVPGGMKQSIHIFCISLIKLFSLFNFKLYSFYFDTFHLSENK